MGRIVDIIVGRNGQIHAAIIDSGGFLRSGTRKIAGDWSALVFASEGKLGAIALASEGTTGSRKRDRQASGDRDVGPGARRLRRHRVRPAGRRPGGDAHAPVDARRIEALLMPEVQLDSARAGQGSKYRRSISRFNERFFGRGLFVKVFEIATRHHGQSGRMSFLDNDVRWPVKSDAAICDQMVRLFWTTICIFWTAIYGFVLWDRN